MGSMLPYIAAPWIRHGWVLHFNGRHFALFTRSHQAVTEKQTFERLTSYQVPWCVRWVAKPLLIDMILYWVLLLNIVEIYGNIWLFDFITEYIGNILGIYWEYIGNILGICGNHMELSILITIYHAKFYQPTSMDDRGFWTLLRVYRRGDEEKSKFRSD